MGDMGDIFRSMKEYKQRQKAEYQKKYMASDVTKFCNSAKSVSENNHSTHFIGVFVTDRGERTVDYWPETGTWMVRNSKARGKGVHNLLKYLSLNVKSADTKKGERDETTISEYRPSEITRTY